MRQKQTAAKHAPAFRPVAGSGFRTSITVASHCRFRPRGFTLVELVAVMVVLAILAAIGASRFVGRKSFDVDAFTDSTRTMLRFGQKVAVAQGRPVYVRLSSPTIALCFDAACSAGKRVQTPAGSNNITTGGGNGADNCNGDTKWYCAVLPADTSYTLNPLDPFGGVNYFYFDQKGKPYAGADPVDAEASSLAAFTISIAGDGMTRDIKVEKETGYVD